MKKLLLVAGLLVAASSAFADVVTQVEGKVDIYAQVLSNLSIVAEPLDFGILGLKDDKTIGAGDGKAGSFSITGAKNSNIILTIADEGNLSNTYNPNSTFTAELKRDGLTSGLTPADVLNPEIRIYDNSQLITTTTFNMPSNKDSSVQETKVFKVGGTINTAAEQNTGNYQGSIRVTAKYDSWAGKKAE